MYKEKIVDATTGEETWRDYTPEEIAEVEKSKAQIAEQAAKEAETQAKRSAAIAKLEALGLDEDDLKALGF